MFEFFPKVAQSKDKIAHVFLSVQDILELINLYCGKDIGQLVEDYLEDYKEEVLIEYEGKQIEDEDIADTSTNLVVSILTNVRQLLLEGEVSAAQQELERLKEL